MIKQYLTFLLLFLIGCRCECGLNSLLKKNAMLIHKVENQEYRIQQLERDMLTTLGTDELKEQLDGQIEFMLQLEEYSKEIMDLKQRIRRFESRILYE